MTEQIGVPLSSLDGPLSKPQKILLYGPPKSGKTKAAGDLAEFSAFDQVIWLDLEQGYTTLLQCSKAAQDKISLVRIYDTPQKPNGIETIMFALEGPIKVCLNHGARDCPECTLAKKKDSGVVFFTLDLSQPNLRLLVVMDSLTQLSNSAMNYALKKDKIDLSVSGNKGKVTFNHYGFQGILLDRVLTDIQAAGFNCVVVSHEREQEYEDGNTKLGPVGGTTNFSRGVGKYFDHIVRMEVKNNRHGANSSTTSNAQVMAGSRTGAKVMQGGKVRLAKLFELPTEEEETSAETSNMRDVTKASNVLKQSTAKQATKISLKR